MPKCPKCTAGKLSYEVQTFGGRKTSHTMDCPYCGGKGEVTEAKHRALIAMDQIWCLCGNPSQQCTFHPDTPAMKHHWTCNDCGKVTQIG